MIVELQKDQKDWILAVADDVALMSAFIVDLRQLLGGLQLSVKQIGISEATVLS